MELQKPRLVVVETEWLQGRALPPSHWPPLASLPLLLQLLLLLLLLLPVLWGWMEPLRQS